MYAEFVQYISFGKLMPMYPQYWKPFIQYQPKWLNFHFHFGCKSRKLIISDQISRLWGLPVML
jgi:hypothetical protein